MDAALRVDVVEVGLGALRVGLAVAGQGSLIGPMWASTISCAKALPTARAAAAATITE